MSTSQLSLYFYRDFINNNSNISGRDRNEMCQLAYSFREQKILILIPLVGALLNVLTLIILYLVFKSKEIRRIYSLIQIDLKFLLVVGFIAYLIISLNSALFLTFKVVILVLDLSPCSYIIDGYFCFFSQALVVSVCPQLIFITFVGMFLERCFVSFGFNSKGTLALSFFLLILAIVPISYFLVYDKTTYQNDRVYCGKFTTTFDPTVTLVKYTVVFVDVIISILDLLLLILNKRRIRAYK
jgi:hypothetical protein